MLPGLSSSSFPIPQTLLLLTQPAKSKLGKNSWGLGLPIGETIDSLLGIRDQKGSPSLFLSWQHPPAPSTAKIPTFHHIPVYPPVPTALTEIHFTSENPIGL